MSQNNKKYIVPAIVGVGLVLFSILPLTLDLYHRFNHFDKLLHLSGGIIVAWFFSRYMSDELKQFHSTSSLRGDSVESGQAAKLKTLLILTAVACLVGVFWEFAEYLSSTYGPAYAPIIYRHFFIGDLADTLGDMLADIIGGFVFALCYIYKKRYK